MDRFDNLKLIICCRWIFTVHILHIVLIGYTADLCVMWNMDHTSSQVLRLGIKCPSQHFHYVEKWWPNIDKTISSQGPFSSYSGAFDHFTWSSSADGIAQCRYSTRLFSEYFKDLKVEFHFCPLKQQLTKQPHFKVHLVAVIELLIVSHDHQQQMSFHSLWM